MQGRRLNIDFATERLYYPEPYSARTARYVQLNAASVMPGALASSDPLLDALRW